MADFHSINGDDIDSDLDSNFEMDEYKYFIDTETMNKLERHKFRPEIIAEIQDRGAREDVYDIVMSIFRRSCDSVHPDCLSISKEQIQTAINLVLQPEGAKDLYDFIIEGMDFGHSHITWISVWFNNL